VVRWCSVVFAVMSVGCSVGALNLSDKQCPCVEGYSCDERRNLCVLGPIDAAVDAQVPETNITDTKTSDAKPDTLPVGPDCSVHADGKLYCTNANPANIRATPDNTATVVDQLLMDYDWFTCWTTGALHAGGNRTWYYTLGDRYGKWGYVAANDLNTTETFDANPTAYGLKHCP
jgi:hypothetical protein